MNEERNYVIEKKKSPILAFMIILTCIVIIGTCVYFIYNSIKLDNGNSNKEENNINSSEIEEDNITNEEEQELEITDEDKVLAQELIDNFSFTKNKMITENYFGYFYNNDSITIDSISNYIPLGVALKNLNDEILNDVKIYISDYEISEKTIKRYVVSEFGNIDYENEDISLVCSGSLTYNSSENKYIYNSYPCGGTLFPVINGKIQDIKKYSDRIEIIEKIVYIEYEQLDNCMAPVYYNHPTEKVLIESPNCENRNMNSIDIINNNIDKLLSYKWTFKKDGSNYYFEKIERMN